MTPRKHAELIKAWADGAEIQRKIWMNEPNDDQYYWVGDSHPTWDDDEVYRCKPVPKADFARSGYVHFSHTSVYINVTFDGETGEPKKVELAK